MASPTSRYWIGWIGSWRPPDYQVLSDQLKQLNDRAARLSGPAVVIMPPLTEPQDLERYYTDHDCSFGFDRCVSIFSAVEINFLSANVYPIFSSISANMACPSSAALQQTCITDEV